MEKEKNIQNISSSDVQQLLERFLELKNEIDSDFEQLRNIRREAESVNAIDYSKERVSGGITSSKIEDAAVLIADFETMLEKRMKEKYQVLVFIENMVKTLEDSTCAVYLRKRYEEGKTWETIAEEMNYSVRNIANIQKRAVKQLVENVKGLPFSKFFKDVDDNSTIQSVKDLVSRLH